MAGSIRQRKEAASERRSITLSPRVLDWIAAFAEEDQQSESSVMAQLIEAGIEVRKAQTTGEGVYFKEKGEMCRVRGMPTLPPGELSPSRVKI